MKDVGDDGMRNVALSATDSLLPLPLPVAERSIPDSANRESILSCLPEGEAENLDPR